MKEAANCGGLTLSALPDECWLGGGGTSSCFRHPLHFDTAIRPTDGTEFIRIFPAHASARLPRQPLCCRPFLVRILWITVDPIRT